MLQFVMLQVLFVWGRHEHQLEDDELWSGAGNPCFRGGQGSSAGCLQCQGEGKGQFGQNLKKSWHLCRNPIESEKRVMTRYLQVTVKGKGEMVTFWVRSLYKLLRDQTAKSL